jgi:fimbrial chaperone protein
MQCPTVNRLKALVKAASLGVALMGWSVMQPFAAWAAEFSVSPIRVQFEPGMRSGVVSIRNADKRPIRFQLQLVEWTQDANGEDVYTPSNNLIYFPRQLTVAPGDRSIVRIGPKGPLSGPEKTYRLRIEELPEAIPESAGSVINLTITFAVPIFLGVTDAKPLAQIAPLQMQDGKLTATVQNTGKSQFRIETLEVTGKDGFTQQMGGWYLLAGSSRQYTLNIPPEACRAQQHLNLNVKVGDNQFTSGIDINPSMCGT